MSDPPLANVLVQRIKAAVSPRIFFAQELQRGIKTKSVRLVCNALIDARHIMDPVTQWFNNNSPQPLEESLRAAFKAPTLDLLLLLCKEAQAPEAS